MSLESSSLVFMIHGFLGHPNEFMPLVDFLESQGVHTHRVCLPEHGDSPGDLTNTCWEEMLFQCETDLIECQKRYEKIHLIGFSLGGALSMVLSGRHPDAFRTLTLAATPFKPVFNLDYGQYYLRNFFNRFLPGMLYHEWDTGLPKPLFNPVYLPRFYREMESLLGEVRANAKKLRLSTLLIHSIYDLTVPYEHSEWFYEVVPGESNLITLLNAGHQLFPYHVKGILEQSILHHILQDSGEPGPDSLEREKSLCSAREHYHLPRHSG